MKHKNDYSVIAFFEHSKPKKWNYVHALKGFVTFLNEKHKGWKYLNVYERRSGQYLKRFYPGNIIPEFLTLIFFASLLAIRLLSFFNLYPKPLVNTFNTFTNGIYISATIPNSITTQNTLKCL